MITELYRVSFWDLFFLPSFDRRGKSNHHHHGPPPPPTGPRFYYFFSSFHFFASALLLFFITALFVAALFVAFSLRFSFRGRWSPPPPPPPPPFSGHRLGATPPNFHTNGGNADADVYRVLPTEFLAGPDAGRRSTATAAAFTEFLSCFFSGSFSSYRVFVPSFVADGGNDGSVMRRQPQGRTELSLPSFRAPPPPPPKSRTTADVIGSRLNLDESDAREMRAIIATS